jgi:hypothetical protein
MSNNASISHEQCLSEEQLLKYVEGTMTRTEERVVDRHIATCDLCSDALEGAMMVSADDFKQHSASISAKIDKNFSESRNATSQKQEPKIATEPTQLKPVRSLRLLRWTTMAAASVLFLGTIGIWLLTTNAPSNEAKVASSEISIEAAPPQYSTENGSEMTSDTAISAAVPSTQKSDAQGNIASATPTKPQPIASQKLPTNDNIAMDKDVAMMKDDEAKSSTSFGSAPQPTTQSIENQPVTQESNNDAAGNLSRSKEEQSYSKYETAKKAKSMPSADKSAATSSAAPTAKPILPEMTDEKIFQTGLGYYNRKDYGNALLNFSKIKENQVGNELKEEVQWYSAMAQLKQGKKQLAKTILENIVAGKGKYAQQATEVLKTSF